MSSIELVLSPLDHVDLDMSFSCISDDTHPLLSDGQFGAYMQVNIQNDGPVTITLDSPPHNQVGQSITCVTQLI